MRFRNRNLARASCYCVSNYWDGCTIIEFDDPSSRTYLFDVFVAEIESYNYVCFKFLNDVKLYGCDSTSNFDREVQGSCDLNALVSSVSYSDVTSHSLNPLPFYLRQNFCTDEARTCPSIQYYDVSTSQNSG